MNETLQWLATTGTNELIEGIIGNNYMLLSGISVLIAAVVRATRNTFDDKVWAAISGKKNKES